MPCTWMPRGRLQNCSRFILEETEWNRGWGQQLQKRTRKRLFTFSGVGAVTFLDWGGGGHAFGAQAVGGGGSSPAQALPLGPAVIQKVLSPPARSDFDPFL